MTTLMPMTRVLDAAFKGAMDNCHTTDYTHNLTPRADVLESETEFRLVLDLPGVSSEGLEINLEKQTLIVKASKETPVPEGFEVKRHERASQVQFSRTFNLGNSVDGENISAKLDAGVLNITLPKSEASKPRRIEVK